MVGIGGPPTTKALAAYHSAAASNTRSTTTAARVPSLLGAWLGIIRRYGRRMAAASRALVGSEFIGRAGSASGRQGALAAAQKHIIGGVGNGAQRATLRARSGKRAAMGIDPLYGGRGCERTAAAMVDDVELEPGDVIGRCAWRGAGGLADDGAAI